MVSCFDDLNDQVEAFNCLFLDVLDKHAPIKRIKIKSRPNPFITPEIRQLMKTRDKWHKTAIKTNDKMHWNAYRSFRQEVKREIRFAEKEHVCNEINNSNEDPKTQAFRFNEYYASVGINASAMADEIAEKLGFTTSVSDYQDTNSNMTPGYDKVTARILKDSLPVTIPTITNLINYSFSSCEFAQVWKRAEVTPCIKSGDPDEPTNTRPISLLPIISKVVERSAHVQFTEYLDSNGKIAQFQSGNRKIHSTETGLLYFTDEILKNMDMKQVSVVVLLDMSKAFDSIRHDLMLSKLRKVGAGDSAITWFESYLSRRTQTVKIQDTLSTSLPLSVGVPQGFILGPLLFTVYVNEILSVPRRCKSMGYVDDTKTFIAFPPRDLSSAISDLNEDLNEISRWCCANSLLINSEKTKVQVIGVSQLIRNLPPIPPIKILGKVINPVPVVKDLGVSIDCYLSYNENTKELVSNCMFKLSRINRIKHLLDRKTILLLMEVFVFSKLFYCSTIWSNTSKQNVKKLQLVQNFAARIVLGLRKYDHISEGIQSLKWLNVKDTLFLNDAVMVHKCLHGKVPAYLSDKFMPRSAIHSRSTRHCNDLNLPK
ncbi:Hypothetical predicted protein, partial [Paramuricea clavata]